MENLLKNDFISHHYLPACTVKIAQNINFSYFEIDDIARNLIVYNKPSNGMVKYENLHSKNVSILDYDGFLTSTPAVFQRGKKRCDVIVHTINESSYFLLNELKEKNPIHSIDEVRNIEGAKLQMIHTLNEINTVPSIVAFVTTFSNKICCYCNSFPKSNLAIISSTIGAFNRLSTLTPDGMHLAEPRIEDLGFIYMELKGNQTIKLN